MICLVSNILSWTTLPMVSVLSVATYEVTLYRWPQIWNWVGVPIRSQVGGGNKFFIDAQDALLKFTDAHGNVLFQATEAIAESDSGYRLLVPMLPANVQMNLHSWFRDSAGKKICTPIKIKLLRTTGSQR